MTKKLISLILSVALILCAVVIPVAVNAKENTGRYMLGDVDGDGRIRITDVSWIQRKLARLSVPGEYNEKAADVDCDNKVRVIDVSWIQRKLARMDTPYAIGQWIEIEQPTEPVSTDPSFVVDTVTASAGESVSVAVNVKNNPGILGMTLTLSYDSSAMTLTNAVSGAAVSDSLAFTKPGTFTSPCNFTWDGLELSDDQIRDGEILILTFVMASNVQDGVYPITMSYEEDSIFDKNLTSVDFDIVNGSITVGNAVVNPTTPAEPTQPTQPTQPATEAPITGPSVVVENKTAAGGETVTVAANIINNPGILGMTLTLSYDSNAMTLTNAVSGAAVSDSLAFTKPGRFTSPCNFTWDGLEISEDQIRDGEILILTFAVNPNVQEGIYPITLTYEDDSIFDKNLTPIDFNIVNGSITVGNAIVNPTTPAEPTQPATEAPITGPAVVGENKTASAGGTVTVAIDINNNPGILGMTLTLTYDSSALTLTNAVNGSAVSEVLAFTKPGKFSSPCNLTWDGLEISEDQIKDGELLVLTFNVAQNAAVGKYPIMLSYEEDSIFNSELLPIDVTVVNGSITVN